MGIVEKICTKCNIIKPIDCFRLAKNYKNGIHSQCKNCEYTHRNRKKRSVNSKRYRVKNKQKISKSDLEYRKRILKSVKILPEQKECSICKIIKSKDNFGIRNGNLDGLTYDCLDCNKINLKIKYYKNKSSQRTSHFKRRQRTPKWANLTKIKEIYNNCPEGYQVDHIIPMNNDLVCGLHVENNLQYLTISDNAKKHNKFKPFIELNR